jgi:penicillin-binding protein 1A
MGKDKRPRHPLVALRTGAGRDDAASGGRAGAPRGGRAPHKAAGAAAGTAAGTAAGGGGGRKGSGRKGPLARALGWVWASLRKAVALVLRLIWAFGWRVGLVVGLIAGLAVWAAYATLPDARNLLDGRARGSVTLLDQGGDVFAWRGEMFGGQITADQVSQHLRNAIIATEDRRFYSHFGISPRGILGAMRINLAAGRSALSGHGGSTITQQVAKLLCLGVAYDPQRWKSEAEYEADCRRGSVVRKLKEVPFAFALEAKYTKDEILTIYLNRAYLGAGARGFEAAAQRYFGKSAAQVGPAEAAMLAGLLVAPSFYAPTRDLERAQGRAAVILRLMAEQGFLTPAQLAEARANPARLSEAAEARAGGYFADWVMETGPAFLTRATTEDVIIHTTLDRDIQRAAEEALAQVFATRVRPDSKAQAAIVVMSADGAVRAMVGGRKSVVAGDFNRATMARRQTGSAFKPFVFAAALDLGYSGADYVEDTPLTITVPGSPPWSPRNYTEDFAGMMTLTEAMASSRNIPAVRISEAVGRGRVRQVASEFGLQSDLAMGPALALGVSEATLLDLTGAYAGILNGGSAVRPYGLIELRLQADRAPLMGKAGGMGERVISDAAARELTFLLSQVIEAGTGTRARLGDRPAAGKTGTTQAARDAWFVGFTADYVAGVWMGNDDNSPLTGVTGGGLPAEIWRETMLRVHQGLPARPLPMLMPPAREAPPPGSPETLRARPETRENTTGPRPIFPDQADSTLVERLLGDVGRFLSGQY